MAGLHRAVAQGAGRALSWGGLTDRPPVPSQMPLPLENAPLLTRQNFIVSDANRDALSFIDSWPAWAVSVAVLYGPPSSGKSHLAEIWGARSGAQKVVAG